jgi:hypothetical protein
MERGVIGNPVVPARKLAPPPATFSRGLRLARRGEAENILHRLRGAILTDYTDFFERLRMRITCAALDYFRLCALCDLRLIKGIQPVPPALPPGNLLSHNRFPLESPRLRRLSLLCSARFT